MNILIIHQGALGDFILSLPAIRSFRDTYPDSSIELWGYPPVLQLVERRFYADTTASIHQEGMALLYSDRLTEPPALIERIRRFDLVVLFGGEHHNTFLENLHRHGIRSTRISTFPQAGVKTHVIDHQLAQLAHRGLHTACSLPLLFPSREDCSRAAAFFRDNQIDEGAFTVALHPGSGSRKKVWPLTYFAALTEMLAMRRGARILVLIGPADADGAREYRRLVSSSTITILDNLPLCDLAAILKRCTVFVGNDSGITHLAAAADIPVVSLFGPTDPAVWGVRGTRTMILRGTAACAPCAPEKMRGCPSPTCMEEISVNKVYDAMTGDV